MPMGDPKGYGKGAPSAVMIAAKGRMADLLKSMMAAKLKAKLGLGKSEESEDEGEDPTSGENEMPSGENELPPEELQKLLEMYQKLK